MTYPWVREAHKIFLGVFAVQFVMSLVIAYFTGAWLTAFLLTIPMIAVPIFMIMSYPDARITRIIVGLATQLVTALHIHMAFGLTELHFEIFALQAFLVFYRDWLVVVITTAFIAVHHILFWVLQVYEFPVYAFEVGHVTFGFLLIHAFFALAEGGVLTYISDKNFKASISAMNLSNIVSKILKDPQKLNLNVELDTDDPKMTDFNRFVISIKDLIEQTRKVGSTVNRVSGHVAELSTGLQKSLSETSVQVDSIASSSEEMSSTIAHVAANASSVNDIATQTKTLSSSAKDTIEGTSKDVGQLRTDLTDTSSTINSLSEKCDRISQVMEAIKVVSEQTNLLALNAAIESARAGEHGRGFAVVADEVRQLAIKTRESVEEISEVSQALINDGNTSVGQMSQCLKSAEQAMDATSEACDMIDEVLAGITQVEASIGSVASSTEQQSMASSSIAASAQQLYDLSQQETASATQTLSEVEELRNHSETLESQLSKFHV